MSAPMLQLLRLRSLRTRWSSCASAITGRKRRSLIDNDSDAVYVPGTPVLAVSSVLRFPLLCGAAGRSTAGLSQRR